MTDTDTDPTVVEQAFRQGYQAAVDELREGTPAPPDPARVLPYSEAAQLLARNRKLEALLRERDTMTRRLVGQVEETRRALQQANARAEALAAALRDEWERNHDEHCRNLGGLQYPHLPGERCHYEWPEDLLGPQFPQSEGETDGRVGRDPDPPDHRDHDPVPQGR
jgi:hypothetical protein